MKKIVHTLWLSPVVIATIVVVIILASVCRSIIGRNVTETQGPVDTIESGGAVIEGTDACSDGLRDEINYIDKRDKALTALVLINHINCVVTKIKTFNNPAVLEEEYRNISQNRILLDVIEDEQIIWTICDIMDAITELRIDDMEREMLKEELDQATSDALFDALSGVRASGMDWISVTVSALTSVASSAANYMRAKRNLQRMHKRKTLTLDETKMRNLNLLNKSLIRNYWFVIKKYGIPDQFRVTEDDIVNLIDRMKDTDNERRFRFLMDNKDKYRALPEYWYWRGETAYELGDYESSDYALHEYQRLQEEGCKVLRYDSTSANVAMLRAKILVDRKAGADEIRKQLEIVKKNTTEEEWAKRYFCAMIYAQHLGDVVSAEKVLSPVIDKIEADRSSNLINLEEKYEDAIIENGDNASNDVDPIPSTGSGDKLYLCKTLLLDDGVAELIDVDKRNQILSKLVDSENASVREKLFSYCSLDFAHGLEKLLPDVANIRLDEERFFKDWNEWVRNLCLPMSWIVARDCEPRVFKTDDADIDLAKLNLNDSDKYIECREEEDRRKIVEIDGKRYGRFSFKRYKGSHEGKSMIALFQYKRGNDKATKKCYQVAVVFDIRKQKGTISPKSAAFGEWNGNSWTNPDKVAVRNFDVGGSDNLSADQQEGQQGKDGDNGTTGSDPSVDD